MPALALRHSGWIALGMSAVCSLLLSLQLETAVHLYAQLMSGRKQATSETSKRVAYFDAILTGSSLVCKILIQSTVEKQASQGQMRVEQG